MKTFHTTKCKTYPLKKLNTLKGVIKSRELSLVTTEEIRAALEKQGVTDYRRITVRKGRVEIQMNVYILAFNQLKIPSKEGETIHPSNLEVL